MEISYYKFTLRILLFEFKNIVILKGNMRSIKYFAIVLNFNYSIVYK